MQQPPEDDGVIHFKRLHPEHFDVVLGSHPTRQKPPRPVRPRSYGLWILLLILLGMLGYMVHSRNSSHRPPQNEPVPQPAAEPLATEPGVQPEAPAEPLQLRTEPSANLAPLPAEPVAAQIQASPPKAQGLVSASYLAEYKADLKAPEATHTRRGEVATVLIREWDGRNRYAAKWRIFNNVIDNASVCANFPTTSTEHRECRKAAEVFFQEQCAEWGKRSNRDKDEQSKGMQARYCTAMQTYSPQG
ncbi:hypothetical protein [Pseudomonas gingeri]